MPPMPPTRGPCHTVKHSSNLLVCPQCNSDVTETAYELCGDVVEEAEQEQEEKGKLRKGGEGKDNKTARRISKVL